MIPRVLLVRLSAWFACAAPLLIWSSIAYAAERPPNIVFLLADDLGYADLACCGHPYARTPNLDQLAREGTRFRRFYVTGVTCCPSRTGFMTSKFPATFATYPANGGFGDRVTVTELLKKAGYATGHVGKWHIGPETKPGTYGIDVTPDMDEERTLKRRNGSRCRDAHIYDAAIKFIEENQSRPFYVNVWGHITHHPVNPPQVYAEKFSDVFVREEDFPKSMHEKFAIVKARGGDLSQAMRNYLGEVFALDEEIGRVLRRLDELGLRENTIVVFSSDHGSPSPKLPGEAGNAPPKKRRNKPDAANADREEFQINLMGFNGELRGGKHGMEEGGVRSPFLIRWPGHVPAGRVDETSVISGIDLLPTLCSLAGVKINVADFDGEDVSAAWLGQTHVRSKPLFWKTSNPRADIGLRDGQWKLHSPNGKRGEAELYDVVRDPMESNNLASQNPQVVKALTARIEAWNASLPTEYLKTDDRND